MARWSWVVGSLTSVGGGGGGRSSPLVDGGGHALVLRVWWWLLVEGRSHVTLRDNGITFKLAHDYICSVITNVVVTCLAVFKVNTIANSSSKPILSHPLNPCMFLMGKLMGYMLKYYRNNNLFLVCVISSRGTQKSQKTTRHAHLRVYLHMFTNNLQVRLQKFVVSAFSITKVCRVWFLRLQKCAVSAFFITNVCSVRFLRLQKFVVSAFFCYQCL